MPRSPTVHFVSLGCPKNRVDSEQMVALVRQRGMEPVAEPERADAIVVHTCGFIGDAAAESVDTILEMARYKSEGRCRALVVTGCLVERSAAELGREIPEIDALLGTFAFTRVAEVLQRQLGGSAKAAQEIALVAGPADAVEGCVPARDITGHAGHAYLKIAEGCDRRCAFCIIPQLRGPQRSRGAAAIVEEAHGLVAQGVRELTLIAQDLTSWGRDLEPRQDLVDLLTTLEAVDGLRWIRCLYAYPQGVTRRLLDTLATSSRVLPYLDVPVQHVSDAVLGRMRRGRGGHTLVRRLVRARESVPQLVLRTTLLVGFPGETEHDFAQLERFVDDVGFDRLGVFAYSDEPGTAAHRMRNKVPEKLAQKRLRAIMRQQQRISRRRLRRLVGTVHEAIVEGLHPESELLVVGRLWSQAPEIDGLTFLSSSEPLSAGDIVRVRVQESHDYDLVAEVIADHESASCAPFLPRPIG